MRLTLKFAILSSQQTQRAISLAAQIPETRLSAIVRGHVDPEPAEKERLAAALNRSPRELFAGGAE